MVAGVGVVSFGPCVFPSSCSDFFSRSPPPSCQPPRRPPLSAAAAAAALGLQLVRRYPSSYQVQFLWRNKPCRREQERGDERRDAAAAAEADALGEGRLLRLRGRPPRPPQVSSSPRRRRVDSHFKSNPARLTTTSRFCDLVQRAHGGEHWQVQGGLLRRIRRQALPL